jgi:hypothetical protein
MCLLFLCSAGRSNQIFSLVVKFDICPQKSPFKDSESTRKVENFLGLEALGFEAVSN